MAHTLKEKNRRQPTLTTSKTGEVLPEYFEADNPKLITLLDEYYKFLDSSGSQSFSDQIEQIHKARDISSTRINFLDELITELGNGLTQSSFFDQPRLMAKLLAGFYRSKGTLVSAEGFFRGFFGEEVVIEYPKEQIFKVGDSKIGFDSQRFIQDNAIYQIFSILVKVGISVQDYEALYKRFVHPAGFHFAGEVAVFEEANIGPFSNGVTAQGLNPLDSAALNPTFITEGDITLVSGFSELTALIDSGGEDDVYRVAIDQSITKYQSLTISDLTNFYPSIISFLSPNSFTFDDSGDPGPDFSMTLETMDNTKFTRYTANILDSAI